MQRGLTRYRVAGCNVPYHSAVLLDFEPRYSARFGAAPGFAPWLSFARLGMALSARLGAEKRRAVRCDVAQCDLLLPGCVDATECGATERCTL